MHNFLLELDESALRILNLVMQLALFSAMHLIFCFVFTFADKKLAASRDDLKSLEDKTEPANKMEVVGIVF